MKLSLIHISSLLEHCTAFCDPFGRLLGVDGVIIMAFLLGFPANEIVIPIMLMAYMAQGSLTDYDSLSQLHQILLDNGWTWQTALSTMLLCLFHFPCGTTCLTIKKETDSWKWTAAAIALPTLTGKMCIRDRFAHCLKGPRGPFYFLSHFSAPVFA